MRERLEIQKGNTNSWLLYFSIFLESQRSEQTGVALRVAHMHNFIWIIHGFFLKPFSGINQRERLELNCICSSMQAIPTRSLHTTMFNTEV